jgi:hypothetical protein
MLAVFPPQLGVDTAIGIERSDEFVAMLIRADREFLSSGRD